MATDEFGNALHLTSEFVSIEFRTEFGFKIRKIPLGFDLVRQSIEQATVSKTHASMSVGGHALPPHPLIWKWLMLPSFKVVVSAALFTGMKSENPRSVLLSSVYNVL